MITETKKPLSSWECYTPDIVFLNCRSCALEFAKDNSIELHTGLYTYGSGATEGIGISECYACGHEFDNPPTCDGCGEYLRGSLTPEGVQYLKKRKFPKWVRDYYLSNTQNNKKGN